VPLLDHFHAPLAPRRHWDSFHATWVGAIADLLNNKLLPPDYFAEETTQATRHVEIDVATFKDGDATANGARVAVAPRLWSPPAPALVMPSVFPVDFEVRVFASEGGATLVAAIEVVSPANKDRPETRRAFVAKCANYLYQTVSLVVIDIVTARQSNLHNELIRFLQAGESFEMPGNPGLYAVAYRPIKRENEQIEIWPVSLSVAQSLPVLPLALNADLSLPLDLELTYTDACQRRRLP